MISTLKIKFFPVIYIIGGDKMNTLIDINNQILKKRRENYAQMLKSKELEEKEIIPWENSKISQKNKQFVMNVYGVSAKWL